ncbi:MAG: hypothetical protein E6L03_10670, partial [Thaumarchaeota archaeon]
MKINSVIIFRFICLVISIFLAYGWQYSNVFIPAESFQFSNDSIESNQDLKPGFENETHIVRDSETILLAGQVIPPGDYIHLYDASPYKIVNGHLATKIPCDQSFQPLLNVLVGQAPKL